MVCQKKNICFFLVWFACVCFWDQTTGKNIYLYIYMVHIGLFSHFFVGD